MKTSQVRFVQLQKLFGEMGFSEARDKDGWRFEHVPSNTVFLFRPYRPTDRVYEHDLVLVRRVPCFGTPKHAFEYESMARRASRANHSDPIVTAPKRSSAAPSCL